MGKKHHKKHKTDKHASEATESVDVKPLDVKVKPLDVKVKPLEVKPPDMKPPDVKPVEVKPDKPALKLVLKMGSAVTEVTEPATYFAESSDPEARHREKKKKKKKKSDKERDRHETEEERRKRKEEKRKKRERERSENDRDGEQSTPPKRPSIEPMPEQTPLLGRPKEIENDQTPLQQLLSHLNRQLQRKDPSGFFLFPVTDVIAPGYSMIIKVPMDFSTMREKIDHNEYQSVTEFKSDFKLMCDNAMTYNRPETIYYKAAKKLLHTGFKMMSKEKLLSLRTSLEFMQHMDGSTQAALLGEETDEQPGGVKVVDSDTTHAEATQRKPKKTGKEPAQTPPEVEPEADACSFTDSTAGEHVLALAEHAADEAQDKLARCKPNSKIGFLRKDEEGLTTLAIVNPADSDSHGESYPVTLGMLVGKLQFGTSCLQGFKEDKRNRITPVTYLNYGPFSTFAPQYDSTFSNLSKEESDVLYSTYGDQAGLQYAVSIQDYIRDCGDYTVHMVDNLLDILSHGEHGKTLKQQKEAMTDAEKSGKENGADVTNKNGISVSKPDQNSDSAEASGSPELPEESTQPVNENESQMFQRRLNETGQLLKDLQDAQTLRLSARPPPNLSNLLGPSPAEVQLAGKVTNGLKVLTSCVAPGDMVSTAGLHKAMGVAVCPVETTTSPKLPPAQAQIKQMQQQAQVATPDAQFPSPSHESPEEANPEDPADEERENDESMQTDELNTTSSSIEGASDTAST
ncbi:bromodomain-containing protein 7-like [Lampetra planeri]